MTKAPFQVRREPGSQSPWPLRQRVKAVLWEVTWTLLCRWTPKPANPWRLLILRWFGATLHGTPFVHQRARIQLPWNVELHDRSCVGDRTSLYSLDRITLRRGASVAQEAYLCAGTHDLDVPDWPLLTAPIEVGEGAFIGARAFVLPGVSIGPRAVVGAASVVTGSVDADTVLAGNPARVVRSRVQSERHAPGENKG